MMLPNNFSHIPKKCKENMKKILALKSRQVVLQAFSSIKNDEQWGVDKLFLPALKRRASIHWKESAK